MTQTVRRKNAELLGWLRASLVAAATYAALLGMHFSPGWGAAALGLAAGVLAALSVDLGVILAIASMSLPLFAANPVVGIAFLLVGMVGTRYLGTDGGSAFLLIAGAFVGALFGPAWMVVPLAGYVLGAGEGALAAAIACVCLELAGVVLGADVLASGVTIHGGGEGIISFAKAPESLFSTEWVSGAIEAISTKSVDRFIGAFAAISNGLALLVQPLVWALGAAVTSKIAVRERAPRGRMTLLIAVVAGVSIPSVSAVVLSAGTTSGLRASAVIGAWLSSIAVAAVAAFVLSAAFPREKIIEPQRSRPSTMSMEDADVDELLRLVATAEDRLASQHTTTKVVMITDMKSFSKMTEEDGSILSAKTIQKHRDLLLPIIERNGGHGKSTGGDGLVAAFEDARSALTAAAQMLRALEDHNASHRSERELAIRIGVAEGEVVLDKGGRPFIGTALNLAARIMNLADGGQAYTAADVASRASGAVTTYSHGPFELKNIARPVEVVEILWADDQTPKGPLSAETVL